MIPATVHQGRRDRAQCRAAKTVTLTVATQATRPIQVGSHYHFFETIRVEIRPQESRGMRLDTQPATAVRFEPGKLATCSSWRSPASASSMASAAM